MAALKSKGMQVKTNFEVSRCTSLLLAELRRMKTAWDLVGMLSELSALAFDDANALQTLLSFSSRAEVRV